MSSSRGSATGCLAMIVAHVVCERVDRRHKERAERSGVQQPEGVGVCAFCGCAGDDNDGVKADGGQRD